MDKIIEKTLKIAKDQDIEKGILFQKRLSSCIIISGRPKISTILGFDASYFQKEEKEFSISVCVVFTKKEDRLLLKNYFYSIDRVWFPYIPGLFSFREGPGFIKCWENVPHSLKKELDLIFVDGHGIFHPRSMGLASYIGLITQRATIGCAKNGPKKSFVNPQNYPGAYTYLILNGEKKGIILRTKKDTKPIWVSPGYLVSIDALPDIVMDVVEKYRIPIPLREAHILSKKLKKSVI